MAKEKVTVDRVVSFYEGIKTIEDNNKLDTKISYRLGRLSDGCRSIIRVLERTQNKMKAELSENVQRERKNWDKKSESEREAANAACKILNEDFVAKIDALMDAEEELEVPTLRLSDFDSKDVPVKFYAMFGQYIVEDELKKQPKE